MTTTVELVSDCAAVTPEGRDYLKSHDIDLCDFDTRGRGVVNGNCGTSTIYVDRIGSGRGRVSWGPFSKGGAMTARNITVTWGPAGGGSQWDPALMASLAYTNSKQVSGKGKFSASVAGSVTVAGEFLVCSIPRHQTNTVTL